MARGSHDEHRHRPHDRQPREHGEEPSTRARAMIAAEETGTTLAAHATRVAELAALVAESLELNEDERHDVEVTALLHDVGKSVLPSGILEKPAALTDDEWAVMKTHTIEG